MKEFFFQFKNLILTILFFSLFFFVEIPIQKIFSQESLWQDYNPYASNIQDGQLIQIKVNETFDFSIDGTWDDKDSMSLNLTPDTVHFDFLKPSKQSKKYKDKAKRKTRFLKKFNFSVAGILKRVPQKPYFKITASKSFLIDKDPAVVQISGLVDVNSIKNNIIESKSIANLKMKIQLRSKMQKDNTLKLKTPQNTNPGQPIVPQANLSDAEKQKYLLKYLQLILGGLQ